MSLEVQAVQIVAGVGQEVQERHRTHKFLDQANSAIFKPHGLYVMVIMYRQGEGDPPDVITRRVDLGAETIVKYDYDNEGTKKFHLASSKTFETEMPVSCAPLIFPVLYKAFDYNGKKVLATLPMLSQQWPRAP